MADNLDDGESSFEMWPKETVLCSHDVKGKRKKNFWVEKYRCSDVVWGYKSLGIRSQSRYPQKRIIWRYITLKHWLELSSHWKFVHNQLWDCDQKKLSRSHLACCTGCVSLVWARSLPPVVQPEMYIFQFENATSRDVWHLKKYFST